MECNCGSLSSLESKYNGNSVSFGSRKKQRFSEKVTIPSMYFFRYTYK